MSRFIINGNKRLSGEISVGGSKNAALPIIFSCILIHGISTITNLPNISDVDVAFEILRGFGAKIERVADSASIDTRNLYYAEPKEELVSKIRASSYLIGSCTSRFGRANIQRFGGCNFDNRPIDMHIAAARALGAEIYGNEIIAKKLRGGDIRFEKISVGATVNAILMAVSAEGKSRIFGFAREPHVISLVDFLNTGGAKIKITDSFIEIEGANLGDSHTEIIPDMIEAGTYIALSLITDSSLKIRGADKTQLKSFLDELLFSGAVIEYDYDSITVSGELCEAANIVTAPYPAFPTDLQPQTAPLLAAFCGGKITEGVWHNRFGYLKELSKFGVDYELGAGCANIKKSKICAANASSPDLRGGVALVLCALRASGQSIIDEIDLIKRGYSDIVNKLQRIGADIKEF